MLVWTSCAHMVRGQKLNGAVVHTRRAGCLYCANFTKKTCTDVMLTFTVYLQQSYELSNKCLKLELFISKQDGKIYLLNFSAAVTTMLNNSSVHAIQ